jgi:fructose-bisphosphate aldolase, class I
MNGGDMDGGHRDGATLEPVRRRLRRLFAFRKGILALDSGPAALDARFRAVALTPSPHTTEGYLGMLLGAPELPACTSGVVLGPADFDRTVHGRTLPETLRAAGVLAGVRADTGDEPLTADARDRVTSGLDGLADRLRRLRGLGAGFAVWSAVASPATDRRGMHVLTANSHAAARFAHLCHDLGLVPVIRVGTRVGDAGGPRGDATMAAALLSIGGHFHDLDVDVTATVICTELEATTGTDHDDPVAAARPLTVLPDELGGVMLAGRGDAVDAASRTVAAVATRNPPWPVTFYVGRHVTRPALAAWRGHADAVPAARRALLAGLATASAALRPVTRSG